MSMFDCSQSEDKNLKEMLHFFLRVMSEKIFCIVIR